MITQDRLRVPAIVEASSPQADPARLCRAAAHAAEEERNVAIDARTLTRHELATVLHEQLGLNRHETTEMVEAFFEIITRALSESRQDFLLSGFGSFQIRHAASRPACNPRTGEVAHVPGRRVVTFHAIRQFQAVGQHQAAA